MTKAAHDDKDTLLHDHRAFLDGMSPEERIMHVAAGAVALAGEFQAMKESIAEAVAHGAPIDHGSAISVPVPLAIGVAEVMGELVAILEEHKLIDKPKVVAFIEERRAAAKARAKEEGKPDGWCPACKTVHGEDEDEEQSPLRGVAAALVSMLKAARAEAERKNGGDEPSAPPPGETVH